MVDVSGSRGTMSQKAKVVPEAQRCVSRFSPAVGCKADRLPGRSIARIWTMYKCQKRSAIDLDVVVNPGSRTPCLNSSDQANVCDD